MDWEEAGSAAAGSWTVDWEEAGSAAAVSRTVDRWEAGTAGPGAGARGGGLEGI